MPPVPFLASLSPGSGGFYALGLLAAFCIGMSKSGFSGISLISVFLFADLYGAKSSVGLTLPLLIAADLVVYPTFRKHGGWGPVWKLLPATAIGLALGWWLLGEIPNDQARRAIGGCILAMVAVQSLRFRWPLAFDRMAGSRAFGTGAGIAGGITTMLANAAGPVIQLYLLSRRLPKMELLGIGARFFLLVNLVKLPLTRQLDLLSAQSLLENAKLLPGVLAGIAAGRVLIGRVPQRAFEWMILGFSVVAAGRLLLM